MQIGDDVVKQAMEFDRFDNMRKYENGNTLGNGRLMSNERADPNAFKNRQGEIAGHKEKLSDRDIPYLGRRIRQELSLFCGYSADE